MGANPGKELEHGDGSLHLGVEAEGALGCSYLRPGDLDVDSYLRQGGEVG